MDIWNPKSIIQIFRVLGTSTSPVHVETDEGEAILKLPSGCGGPDRLICEFVGTSLARLLDIPTPDFILFRTDPDFVELMLGHDKSMAEEADCFLSRFEHGVRPMLPGVVKEIRNKEVLTQLVFLDTWIRNEDRYFKKTDQSSSRHASNVFLVENGQKKEPYDIKAIDHSEAFKCYDHSLEPEKHFGTPAIEDPKVFGCFPEFVDFLDPNEAYEISRKLCSIGKKDVESILNRIPEPWGMPQTTKDAFCSFIIQRAASVATYLPKKLFPGNIMFLPE